MVPNGSASKVDVEVSETAFHAHQTVPVAQKRGSRNSNSVPESQEVHDSFRRARPAVLL